MYSYIFCYLSCILFQLPSRLPHLLLLSASNICLCSVKLEAVSKGSGMFPLGAASHDSFIYFVYLHCFYTVGIAIWPWVVRGPRSGNPEGSGSCQQEQCCEWFHKLHEREGMHLLSTATNTECAGHSGEIHQHPKLIFPLFHSQHLK